MTSELNDHLSKRVPPPWYILAAVWLGAKWAWLKATWRTLFLALLSVWMALPVSNSSADSSPTVISQDSGCFKYLMCDAETSTGVCKKSSDEIVAHIATMSHLTFYGLQGVGAYSCDFYTNDRGYDIASGAGLKFNTTLLTPSNPVISYDALFDYVWVNCSSIGTSATVILLACPASR